MFSASKTSGPSGYNLTNSLRFRSSASAFLNRTVASTGNRTTYTFSAWVKRGALTTATPQYLFQADNYNTGGTSGDTEIYFGDTDKININLAGTSINYNLITTAVYRDPSAWYHIVVAFDTTQATAANRIKLYINGNQVTAFDTANYPPQNTTTLMNVSGSAPSIGAFNLNGTRQRFFDGYMDEINFIDGQALTPSSFGSTNPVTGVWQPAKYTGTYGTNGFYLNFTDIALTSGSNTGLGRDFSGNGNFWNTNNISVTSGVTYDAMTDSPTLTSATVANYPVMNVLNKTSDVTLSNGNLTFASTGDQCTPCTMGMTSGKWYFEVTNTSGSSTSVGIMTAQASKSDYLGSDTFGYAYWGFTVSYKMHNGSNVAYGGGAWSSGDVVGCYYDADNGTIGFTRNGTDYGNAYTGINTSNEWFFAVGYNGASCVLNINFGQRPFAYTPPTGFVALNTYNLPDSTIKKGNSYMDATAYTGTNGSPTTQVISSNFQPDFLWFKKRSASYDHALIDTNRGITKQLYSNLTNAEGTDSNVLTAIGASSFTVGNSNYSNYGTLVAWTWKANGGTTSSNTAGSITSTVQANTTAGFSIVTYTGTGTTATIGHGLGVAPAMIITKNRTTAGTSWITYHSALGATRGIYLDLTNAAATGAGFWNNTAPTSSVFTVFGGNDSNTNGNAVVAYCWAEIAGFSRFGSYTGNGSADGTFVFTGFLPKYILIKASSFGGLNSDWFIYDTARNPYNTPGNFLCADLSQAEASGVPIDCLANGFKLRGTGSGTNSNGATYIFAAFASNPFKNTNAF